MSQYRLWLHYREIDRQLHTQLDELEDELAQLSNQFRLFDDNASGSQNEIIQALLAHFAAQDSLATAPVESSSSSMPSAAESTPDELPVTTVSQALFAWSRLPNFDSKELQEPMGNAQFPAPLSPAANPDLALLPDDMTAFFSTYVPTVPTAPQAKLPWWLRNTFIASNSAPTTGNGPVDQQSIRTNILIQRWLARRARLSTEHMLSSEEEQSQ